VGDELLKDAVVKLAACIRETDILGRLGGDEFVALLRDIAGEHVAAQVAGRMLEACAQPFITEAGLELFVTASIGISIHPRDGNNGDDLLRNADVAMYRAKMGGKNKFQFFSPPAFVG
jgi:diguanylate cyclase (GGDEF)-like protein